MSEDKLYSGYKHNATSSDKIYINYRLNAYCIVCNIEYPKPKSLCPICHRQLRQHPKVRDIL